MPSFDRVNTPAGKYLLTEPGEITLLDLAYDEYVHRDRDGDNCAHVEEWFAHLSRVEQGLELKVLRSLDWIKLYRCTCGREFWQRPELVGSVCQRCERGQS